MEESGSIKKVLKELGNGKSMLTKIRNREGKLIADRSLMLEEVTHFYKELYGRDRDEEGEEEEERGSEDEESQDFPEILGWEVANEIKRLKRGKAPGPDNIENSTLKDFAETLENPRTRR